MTANTSTPSEGDETSGIDTSNIDNVLCTDIIQQAKFDGYDAETVAERLRAHAEALEEDGYSQFTPGL